MAVPRDRKPKKKRLTPKDIAAFDRAVAAVRKSRTRAKKRKPKEQ